MQLFILDIDGTITNSVAAHHRSFEKAFTDVGILEVNNNWASYTHHTDSWIFKEAFQKAFGRYPDKTEKNAFAHAVHQNFEKELQSLVIEQIPGALDFYRDIACDSQLAYAFATGSFRLPAIRKLESIGIEFPMELLVSADEFETREDIVTNAITAAQKYFGVAEFHQTISIGDGCWDFLTAQNLKLEFIGIAAGASAEKLRSAGALNIFPYFLAEGISRFTTTCRLNSVGNLSTI